MTLDQAAFLLGPVGALLIAPLAMVVLVVRRRPTWAVWVGGALAAVVWLNWLGYWFLWGRAFDYADAFEPVPTSLETALGVTMTVAALGCLGLAVTALTALLRSPSS